MMAKSGNASGIKRGENALLAAKYGADAVGLLVGQTRHSPDFISFRSSGTNLPRSAGHSLGE
jgi:hypothetical protein